jgi:hypothetical protein
MKTSGFRDETPGLRLVPSEYVQHKQRNKRPEGVVDVVDHYLQVTQNVGVSDISFHETTHGLGYELPMNP